MITQCKMALLMQVNVRTSMLRYENQCYWVRTSETWVSVLKCLWTVNTDENRMRTSLAPRVKREYRQIAKKRKSQDEVVPWADAAPPIVASGQRPAPLFRSSWMTDCNINSQYVPWLRYYAAPSQMLVSRILLDFILQLLHDMTALRCPLLATYHIHACILIHMFQF